MSSMKAWKVCPTCTNAFEMPVLRRECPACGHTMVVAPLVRPQDPALCVIVDRRNVIVAEAIIDELLASAEEKPCTSR